MGYQTGNFPLITNIAQLHEAVRQKICAICTYSLRGQVLAATPAGIIFFQDESGFEILETNLKTPDLRVGQLIQLRGTNYVVPTEYGVSLGRRPVADIDGCHPEFESAGSVYLASGQYPIEVLWFTQTNKAALSLYYSSQDFPRKPIPDESLFRFDNERSNHLVSGVQYQCYEGVWQQLPQFEEMVPTKIGVAQNFNLNVRTKTNYVGLVFNGILAVKKDGPYTFYLSSSDGGRLFINNAKAQLQGLELGETPPPRKIVPEQNLTGNTGAFWAETEGVVSFIGCRDNSLEMDLESNGGKMEVKILETRNNSLSYLLGSRVRLRGACLNTSSGEGKGSADEIVVPNWGWVEILETAPERWLTSRSLKIGDGLIANEADAHPIVNIRGKIQSGQPPSKTILEDETGSLPIVLLTPSAPPPDIEVEFLGRWEGVGTNSLLRDVVWRTISEKPKQESAALPVLTTALQVEQLTQEEARRGYLVHLKGVITWASDLHNSIVLNDSTRGVFVSTREAWVWDPPRVREAIEINGVTVQGAFAPYIVLRSANRLGIQSMPTPLKPTWEQLIGGSFDCQYVEIRGLVTGIEDSHLFLIMPGGKLDVDIRPSFSGYSSTLLHTVVRIRGVMFAKWDQLNHQVMTDHPLWIGNTTVNVEVPAPADPFKAEMLRAKQLAQFDVRRDFFRRVRVIGEVLHGEGLLYYAVGENFGFRFQLAQPQHFEPGDNVEVVGLVHLGTTPQLSEAVARKINQLPLPSPQPIILAGTNATLDSTRVWTEGILIGSKTDNETQILDMRSEQSSFVARVTLNGQNTGNWRVGSLLKLTGVYSTLSHDPPSFDLLLNSPMDVELLARPPFWTLARLSAITSILTVIIILVLIWIYELRKQVKYQVILLEREIVKKEQTERAYAIEQERSRIARDLHDELGSGLTAINLLSVINSRTINPSEPASQLLKLIADRSRSIVTSLDEMVWAVDPKNDTLSALVEYLASYAEEFLGRPKYPVKCNYPLIFLIKLCLLKFGITSYFQPKRFSITRFGMPNLAMSHCG